MKKLFSKFGTKIKQFLLRFIAKRSKGEKEVIKYLKGNKIKFKQQVPLKIDNKQLFLDFQLHNGIIIEYNGRQHYRYTPYFHKSKQDFVKQQNRDKKLRKYCEDNNIKLIEIPYYINNINTYLKRKLQ